MRRDLLFETARFNLSVVGAHFINPCCFGEDAAAWLRTRLVERGVDAGAPFQEDWGWGLGATHAGGRYFVGVGGVRAEGAASTEPDRAEWRIIVERHRSLRDRLTGRGHVSADDPLLRVVRELLQREPDFARVRDDDETRRRRELTPMRPSTRLSNGS